MFMLLTTCSRILAGNVKEVADKYVCPSEHTRKGDRLDWLRGRAPMADGILSQSICHTARSVQS